MIRDACRAALACGLFTAVALSIESLSAAPTDPWVRIRSGHFEVLTTAGERSGRDLIRHFEQVRGFFLQVFGLKSAETRPARIIAFHSEKEFRPYSPNEVAAAFYHHSGDHDSIVMQSADAEHYQVATHEYTHLLIGQFSGEIPLWLNEGLAELYSTLRQIGDKVVVGTAPQGRADSLLHERWIPLSVLLSTSHDSPLYNEKSHAGLFYAECWALVHMLNLDTGYRAHLHALLDALKTVDSVAAFQQVYGKSIDQVQSDLEQYVTQQYLHGVAFQAPLEKAVEPETEPRAGMGAHLALAEMMAESPAKVEQAAEMYRQLTRDFPDRWEVEAAAGRFDWRERRNPEAAAHFARAAELGATDARMFLDYSRALNVLARPEESVAALRNALRLDSGLQEAHYELGIGLLRTGGWRESIAELQLARPVKAQQAPHYFYGIAYSEYRLGDVIAARNHLEQGRTYAKIPEEISALNQLSQALGPPIAEGLLESVECQGNAARLHVQVNHSARMFLVPDVTQAKDLTCGKGTNIAVRIEFQAMPAGTTGADGIVRSLVFSK
jgi:tetratricopeptide (TPR) repeat protein